MRLHSFCAKFYPKFRTFFSSRWVNASDRIDKNRRINRLRDHLSCIAAKFWLNSLFILRDYKKNDLMRLPCLPVLCVFKKADDNTDHNDAEREGGDDR